MPIILDGQWASWSEWTDGCESNCLGGTRKRSRTCSNQDCVGDTIEKVQCPLDDCDGKYAHVQYNAAPSHIQFPSMA